MPLPLLAIASKLRWMRRQHRQSAPFRTLCRLEGRSRTDATGDSPFAHLSYGFRVIANGGLRQQIATLSTHSV
jgi:hypothetical protein